MAFSTSRSRPFSRAAITIAMVGGALLSQSLASAALADTSVPVSFDEPASQTVEYGQFWSLAATASDPSLRGEFSSAVTTPGETSPYWTGGLYFFQTANNAATSSTYFSTPPGIAPLNVGTVDFSLSFSGTSAGETRVGVTSHTARLTVTPAAIAIDLRILTDPSSMSNAIVTAKLTGRFIDDLYVAPDDPSVPVLPAGTWKIVLTDVAGKAALERTIEQSAGDSPFTSFYWADAKPDEVYSGIATFTPDADSAKNFAIEPSLPFSYTGGPAPATEPTPTPTPVPENVVPAPGGPSMPLWSVILLGIVGLALAVTVALLAVRLRNAGVPTVMGGDR